MKTLTDMANDLSRVEYELIALTECCPATSCDEATCRDTRKVNRGEEKKKASEEIVRLGFVVTRPCPFSELKHPTITPLGRAVLSEYRALNDPTEHHRIDIGEMDGILDELDGDEIYALTIEPNGIVRTNGVYRGFIAADVVVAAFREHVRKTVS